jgi:hypothetical protein
MARDWEDQLRAWAKPPSEAETKRCETAISNVRAAISESKKLRDLNVDVILQGSYRNNTNVRRDSDVDIGVICPDPFFTTYPQGYSDTSFGNESSNYTYSEFKNEVEGALVKYFRQGSVGRGNKAINVRESDRQVEADVAAFFAHRYYLPSGGLATGVELRPDTNLNLRVINWPEQHYASGVHKNALTRQRYKGLVRGLKNIRNELEDSSLVDGEVITGFLCECLLWNVPDPHYEHEDYADNFRGILVHLYNALESNESCVNCFEVNTIKSLFGPGQKWTREHARQFIVQAWTHLGFS